jgi:hypothetical protein
MTAEQSEMQGGDAPLAKLERALIDEFVRERGYDPLKLQDLAGEERAALLKAASVYASGKLMEVETRSRFLQDIHDDASLVRRTGRG